MRLSLLIGLALSLAFASPPVAYAQINGTAAASNEKNFGRIVITFDRLPGYKNELASGVLVLSFDEAVRIDLRNLTETLADYLAIVHQDPDGRALRFALNRSFKVNIMEAGKKLFIDIMQPSWVGAPPTLPQDVIRALARAAAEAEAKAREEERQRRLVKIPYKLGIRLAQHPTFSRIVFEWNKFVTINMSREGGLVRLKFGQKAAADLSRFKVDPPKFLRAVKTKQLNPGMAIELTVDDDVDVRGFREGLSYVVDLTGPDQAADGSAAKAAEAIDASKKKEATEKKQASAAKNPKATTSLASGTEGSSAQGADVEPEAQPAFRSAIMRFEPGKYGRDAFGDVDAAEAPDPRLGRGPSRALVKPAPKTWAPERKQAAPAVAEEAVPQLSSPGASAPRDGSAPVVVGVRKAGANLRIVFPFAKAVSGAVFRRGRTIWIVFDTDAVLDDEALRNPPGDKVVETQHVRSGRMQYYRLRLSHPWLSYVAHNRDSWTVDIGDMITGQAESLNLKRALRGDSRSVIKIALNNPGGVHWLRDPEIGDRLAIITAFAPPRNVSKSQDFVEFTALPTTHGIAIRPNSDDVGVRQRFDEIIVTRHKGLTLSAGYAHQYAPGKQALDLSARAGFLDFAAWHVKDPAKLSRRIHELQRAIALNPDEEKDGLRFALARLYLANGLHAETLGVLRQMAIADPEVAKDPSYNIMHAAAHVLTRRHAEAHKDLQVHALANDQDASLWRGLLQLQRKEWKKALRSFHHGSIAIESYRPDIQARFRLAAARAALELKQPDRAASELDALPEGALPREQAAEAGLVKGWYQAEIGQNEAALRSFDRVLKGTVRPAVAEAELRTIALLLRMNRISTDDALKSLERLHLVWRGDDVELGTLRLLADLYVKKSRYRDAFNVMKQGVIAYPKSMLALRIQDDMKEVFKDLYISDRGDKLKPIDALSLYYDHRELTPVGRLGDEMIRRLSDRLVDVDLLDQAAEVLDYQVRKRLKGAARAQVATRLAMVHLMNRKPDLALRVLGQTRQAGLPRKQKRARKFLEARALGELGRAETAIEILNTMQGDDVERLKSDALWTSQSWQKSGEQFEKMLGTRWQKPDPLNALERFDTLRAAISYSLANDQFALDRLRKKFYQKMSKTPDAEAFALVTKPVRSKGIDFRKLAKEIAATDTLDAFMKSFRKRFIDPKSAQGRSGEERAG